MQRNRSRNRVTPLVVASSVTYTPASGAGNAITFTFDTTYPVGQYANGDWWVAPNTPGGTVTITAMSPNYSYSGTGVPGANSTDTTARNGYEINPMSVLVSGLDGRLTGGGAIPGFNSLLVPPLPLVLTPSVSGTLSVLKAVSITSVTDVTPLQYVAVLTVVDVATDYSFYFRPSYRGNWNKTALPISAISTAAIPHYTSSGLNALKASVTFSQIKTQMQGLRLDHAGGAPSRYLHAVDNFAPTGGLGGASYQVVIANLNASALMRFMFDDFDYANSTHKAALINYLQAAIDATGPCYSIPAINASATVTVNATTDRVSWAAHGLTEHNVVWFNNATPANIPGGIINTVSGVSATLYYVVNPTLNDFQISLTKYGTPVDITSAGSGTLTCSTAWLANVPSKASASQNTGTGLFATASQSFYAGMPVTITGTPPTGFSNGVTYYVIATGLTTTACELSATVGGAAIIPSVSSSCTLVPASHTYNLGDILEYSGVTYACSKVWANRFNNPTVDVTYFDTQCLWSADGGHGAGRKPLLLAASVIMPSQASFFTNAIAAQEATAMFGDDGHTFQTTAGGTVLWGRTPGTGLTGETAYWAPTISNSGAKDLGDYYAQIDGGSPIYADLALTMSLTNASNTITIAQGALPNIHVGAKIYTAGNNFATNPAYVGTISNNGVTTTITTTLSDLTTANNANTTSSVSCTFYSAHVRASTAWLGVGVDGYQPISSAAIKYNAVSMRMLFGTAQSSTPSAQWGNSRPFLYANRYVSSGCLASPDTKPPYTTEALAPYGSGFLPNSDVGGSGRVTAMNGALTDYYGGYSNTFNDACWTDWALNHP